MALVTTVSAAAAPQRRPGSAIVITDSLERRIEVPAGVRRIVSLEPEITRIIIALGGGGRLVGLDYFLRSHDHVFPLIFPSGGRLPVVSNSGQFPSVETILELKPDVVFTSPSESEWSESLQKKIRTPVVALASVGRFANLLREVDTLGRILGREDRADELTGYFRRTIDGIRSRLNAVTPAAAPKVYLSFWGSLTRTPVFYEPLDSAGGVNCAAGVVPSYLGTAGATVGLEQIIRWDPDVILIQGTYPPRERAVRVEDVLSDARLSSVRAIRSRRVHYTFGFWYWWDPALVLVETAYLVRLLHPEAFPGFDLGREGEAVFKEFYGVGGAFSALTRILKCDEWLSR